MKLDKIKKDPYYGELYTKYGLQHIIDGGYFEDSTISEINLKETLNFLCTPIPDITDIENPCVLLTTGSFNPVHSGHIQIMRNARNYVEELGYNVVKGYISIGHKEYVKQKTKEFYIESHKRIDLIHKQIKKEYQEDWLTTDNFEPFGLNALNFTQILERLDLYLEKYLGKKIPIFYVCGGDNAKFCKAFSEKGNCIVVHRPNNSQIDKYKYLANDRIHFIHGNSLESSTNLRTIQNIERKKTLQLRFTNEKFNNIEWGVFNLLEKYYTYILTNYADKQHYETFIEKPLISLDSCIRGDENIEISRLYDLFGGNKLGFINRIGSNTIQLQLDKIDKEKEYILYDDDISSGETIEYVSSLLENNDIRVNGIFSFTNGNKYTEILDARDFLFNQENSGLSVQIGQNKIRLPYIYPFVCPYMRGSIKDPINFSIDVWEYNKKLYGELKLKDMILKPLFEILELNLETTFSDYCEYNIKFLKNSRV